MITPLVPLRLQELHLDSTQSTFPSFMEGMVKLSYIVFNDKNDQLLALHPLLKLFKKVEPIIRH